MSKTTKYKVADGVTWVAGRAVKPGSTIDLTPAEALYEAGIGRIEPKRAAPAKTQEPVVEEDD